MWTEKKTKQQTNKRNSWGSGANPWGFERDHQFSVPNHWDGMLEVVGVTGVVHLGQIQSGLRSAIRIAQVTGDSVCNYIQLKIPDLRWIGLLNWTMLNGLVWFSTFYKTK